MSCLASEHRSSSERKSPACCLYSSLCLSCKFVQRMWNGIVRLKINTRRSQHFSLPWASGFLVDNETWFTFSQAVLLLLLYLQQERHFCSSGEWPTGKQTFTDFLFLFCSAYFPLQVFCLPILQSFDAILISHLNISKYHVWTSNCLDATTKRISTWNAVPNLLQSAALTICSWWPSRPSKRCLSRLSATKASTSLVSILQTWMKQSYSSLNHLYLTYRLKCFQKQSKYGKVERPSCPQRNDVASSPASDAVVILKSRNEEQRIWIE